VLRVLENVSTDPAGAGFDSAVLDSLSSQIAVLDSAGVIVAVNRAWRRFALENAVLPGAAPRHTEVGCNYLAVCDAGDGAHAAAAGIRRVLRGEAEEFTLEYACHSPQQRRWFLMAATPLDGAGRGAVVAHTNITARKLAEEALRQSEARNRALVSAIPDLIFTIGRDGEYLDVHAADPGMLMLPPEAFLHKRIGDIMPAPLADAFLATIAETLDSGAMREMRYWLPQGTGERYYEARIAPAGADSVVAIVRDVTASERERRNRELKTAQLSGRLVSREADLRESEQRLALAADAANLGIWIRNMTRGDFWASDNWRKLFGFAPGDLLDVDAVLRRIHPADRARAVAIFQDPAVHPGNADFSLRVLLPDGELRWISSRMRIEFDLAGQPIWVRGVSLDVTPRKLAELEIQQKQQEITYLARVATLGELSGALAHELNQPLAAILANAQAAQRFLARETPDLDEMRDILQDIVDEDKRAGEVIRRLRRLFAKGEASLHALDLNDLVQEVVRILRNELINRGVTLRIELAPALPPVRADRVQLEQVVLNLVANACDAMEKLPAAERLVTIRTAHEADGARLSVTDRGPGIAPDEADLVFAPFVTSKAHGMGLGLSICRNIVGAHGGKLWFENHAGRGASFHFVLPADAGAAA
jgi:signal transduction histidine kinase